MTDGLDIVSVRIEHECRIVTWMILCANSRRAVFCSVRSQPRGMEGIDIRRRSGIEGDMHAGFHRDAFGYPEFTSRIGAFAMSFRDSEASETRAVITKDVTKSPQRLDIKCGAFFEIADGDPQVVNHRFPFFNCSAEQMSLVRGGKILHRTQGDDSGRVDGVVAAVIMVLDVIHMHGRGDAGPLVQVA